MPLPLHSSLQITGPARSGKTSLALEYFHAIPGSLYVVPTATMAEHMRHQLARDGHAVRPSRIQTLAQFLATHSNQKPATPATIQLLIQRALARQQPSKLSPLAAFEGLHAALAQLLDEAEPRTLPNDLANLLGEVEGELVQRGMGPRRLLLQEAELAALETPAVIFDGFFRFSRHETEMLESRAQRTRVILTLPEWPTLAMQSERLLRVGFTEQRLAPRPSQARRTVISAATMEQETEMIASRVLQAHRDGRAFREIGILLRSKEPYAPLLTTTLARFAIPARSYFPEPLDAHPVIGFVTRILRSFLAGWDHALLLEALRMPVAGIGATAHGDRLDFAWREQIPRRGLPLLAGEIPLDAYTRIEAWRGDRIAPAAWAERIKSLRQLVPVKPTDNTPSRLEVDGWRSTATALAEFGETLDETAAALGTAPVLLPAFWELAERALALTPLRIRDRRRDVVHVIDVFEARQWQLPMVFVCGMIERHFPQYHREDPLLGDAVRRNLGLETAAGRQAQERSLFEFAVSRATEEVILSYPRFDEKGANTLPSFFLPEEGQDEDCYVFPKPRISVPVIAPPAIQDERLLQGLATQHRTLSPSSIEAFAQCPFKFFANKTLRVRERPPEPRDRLDIRLQGDIMHRALAEWVRRPLLGAAIFDQVFEEDCRKRGVPRDYRREAVRLEMSRNFTAFIAQPQARLVGWESRLEEKFEFALHPGLAIRGRIDRLEANSAGAALVIDYKYSAANKVRERVQRSSEGQEVQSGLYLLAAERQFDLRPAGMLFCGLKRGVAWEGWHVPLPGFEAQGVTCTAEVLRDLMHTAERTARDAHASILGGHILARPADTDQCRYCDYRDACRVETIGTARGAGS